MKHFISEISKLPTFHNNLPRNSVPWFLWKSGLWGEYKLGQSQKTRKPWNQPCRQGSGRHIMWYLPHTGSSRKKLKTLGGQGSDSSFQRLNDLLMSDTVLASYNPHRRTSPLEQACRPEIHNNWALKKTEIVYRKILPYWTGWKSTVTLWDAVWWNDWPWVPDAPSQQCLVPSSKVWKDTWCNYASTHPLPLRS